MAESKPFEFTSNPDSFYVVNLHAHDVDVWHASSNDVVWLMSGKQVAITKAIQLLQEAFDNGSELYTCVPNLRIRGERTPGEKLDTTEKLKVWIDNVVCPLFAQNSDSETLLFFDGCSQMELCVEVVCPDDATSIYLGDFGYSYD